MSRQVFKMLCPAISPRRRLSPDRVISNRHKKKSALTNAIVSGIQEIRLVTHALGRMCPTVGQ
jgi:hypothetical protein